MVSNTTVQDAVSQAFDRAMPQVEEALQRAQAQAGPEEAEKVRAAATQIQGAVAQLRSRMTSDLSSGKLDIDQLLGSVAGMDETARAALSGMDAGQIAQAVRQSVTGAVDGIVGSARANPRANVNRGALDSVVQSALGQGLAPVAQAKRQAESAVAALI